MALETDESNTDTSAAAADPADGQQPVVGADPSAAAGGAGAAAGADGGKGADAAAGGEKKPASVLDAVKDALAANADDAAKKAATDDAKQKEGEAAADAGKKAEGDGKQADAKDGEQPNKDKGRRPDAASRIRELTTENKALGVRARHFDELSGWVQQNGLTQQDVTTGLELMRRLRASPASAMELLTPIMQHVQSQTGELLPPDLREKVEQGVVDEGVARELAASRANAARREQLDTQAAEAARTATEQAQYDANVQAHVQNVAGAVTAWENDWQKNDPDYKKKQPLVRARVSELIQSRGLPQTPDEAVALSKEALTDIEQIVTGFVPPKQAMKPVTGGGAQRVVTAPASSLEAAKAALANMGA